VEAASSLHLFGFLLLLPFFFFLSSRQPCLDPGEGWKETAAAFFFSFYCFRFLFSSFSSFAPSSDLRLGNGNNHDDGGEGRDAAISRLSSRRGWDDDDSGGDGRLSSPESESNVDDAPLVILPEGCRCTYGRPVVDGRVKRERAKGPLHCTNIVGSFLR